MTQRADSSAARSGASPGADRVTTAGESEARTTGTGAAGSVAERPPAAFEVNILTYDRSPKEPGQPIRVRAYNLHPGETVQDLLRRIWRAGAAEDTERVELRLTVGCLRRFAGG